MPQPPTRQVGRAPTFVAADFETANESRGSACALGLVRVERGRVTAMRSWLIRPPSPRFRFTHIHGIRWGDVVDAPSWDQLWPTLQPWLHGVDFLAAHNASFDRSVLQACCRAAGIGAPALPWVCTVALARRVFGIYPTTLPDVCSALGIALHHHDPLSDARACAEIVLEASAAGA